MHTYMVNDWEMLNLIKGVLHQWGAGTLDEDLDLGLVWAAEACTMNSGNAGTFVC